jgi:hypothetical protein
MGRPRTGIVLAIVAVLVALVAAPSASARHVQVHVNIKDQNGYRMSIEASRSARRVIQVASSKVEGPNASAPVRALSRRHAAEVARRAKVGPSRPGPTSGFLSVQVQNHHAISVYGVQGTVTHNRLFAKLGDLGRISLHFHLRHARNTNRGCLRQHERLGVWKGRVRFRGEDDYVNVDTRELHGKVEIEGGRTHRCSRIVLVPPPVHHHKVGSKAKPGSGRHEVERYTLFYAQKSGTTRPSSFAAIKKTRGEADFFADVFELRGRVLIDREEYGEGSAGDFRTSKRFKTARIHPSPRAFRGAGHFHAHHNHDNNRWKGSLATSFPGAPHVRLAGRKFEARLRRLDLSR